MKTLTHETVSSILDAVKAMYALQAVEISKKMKNIELIDLDNLVKKIEQEIPADEIPKNYVKIISIIESIIQD
jgi:hypothetical protein